MKNSKISVLMSSYNEPIEYVQKAVNSILNQTYKYFEFIIVIDNPNNSELISFLSSTANKDERIILLINKRNIGLAMSLNRALSVSTGGFIARMDADDISKQERLEHELNYLITNELDVVGCEVDKIDEQGNVLGTIKSYSSKPEIYARMLPFQNVIVHPTVLMKTEAIKSVNGYRNFPSCQDYDLWLRLLSKGYKIGVIPENLFQFRRHNESITATRKFDQFLNESYIRKLFIERKENHGVDSFSDENLKNYLSKKGFFNQEYANVQNQLLIQYNRGINNIKNHNYKQGLSEVIQSMKSNAVISNICISLKTHLIRKKYTKR